MAKDGSVVIKIPAGAFPMGSGDFESSGPVHEVDLSAYFIGRFEVTNGQFKRFLEETGYTLRASRWMDFYEEGLEEYPVVHVSWHDAVAYCKWAGMRLPTEAEWEKAARGPEGRKYPWGEDWNGNLCNNLTLDDSKLVEKMAVMDMGRGTIPVGSIPAGASPFGVMDLIGNAVEWCSSAFEPYPYSSTDGRESPRDKPLRVLRGGCWFNEPDTMSAVYRDKATPEYWYFYNYVGFRVAWSPGG